MLHCLLLATLSRVWPCFSYYVLATYIYCRLILLWKNYLMEFTPPVTVYIHSLFQLLYHLFLSQTADPPLSKATKVARLQLAYKPGSSSSQRALLLSTLSYASHVSHFCHFPFPISSFLVPGFTSSRTRPSFSRFRTSVRASRCMHVAKNRGGGRGYCHN